MIIPLHTDRPPRRTPVITQALIALNVIVYLAGVIGQTLGAFDAHDLARLGHFDPQRFVWWQLLSSLFLHDPHSIWHLAFNMLFLWVFGAPVEDRLGRAGFLCFYLMAGALANLAHMIVNPNPVIGASGAIAGVSGAFLALFPRSRIVCLFLIGLGLVSIPSPWFIGLYFVIDLLRQTMDLLGATADNVSYAAHLAGYIFGFALAFVLLGLKVIGREEYDVFFLFKQWRRRAALRAINRSAPTGVFESAAADTGARLAAANTGRPLSEDQRELAALRSEVMRFAAAGDLAAASRHYARALARWPQTVFSEPLQLELANQLYADGQHHHAALAYEALLKHHPAASSAEQVRLILALLCIRSLGQPDKGRSIINAVKPSLHDADQQALADQLLAEAG